MEFLVGSSLAAAAGLNAWMPLFALGLLDRLLPGFALPNAWSWLSGDVALWIIGALLVVEIVADKIPAVDSVNDVIQTVVRPASGGIAFGAGVGAQEVADPARLLADGTWVPVLIGVVIALLVHLAKAAIRPVANMATAGLAAPALSTAEDISSLALALAAILAPVIAGVLLVGLAVAAVVLLRRRRRSQTRPQGVGLRERGLD
ncbi:MAG: DUF4126 domain-containing protein [Microbacterium sp.]|nr:MAG: DUF4126 domain-containing protein [Microbacterium sp.]PZU38183.1 MAG: DUF4126 domain-containing protein [Microbacterium sp.]